MTPDITVETHNLDGAAHLCESWQALANRSLEPSVFSEPAFLLAAARHLAHGASPTILTAWRRPANAPAQMVGLCPIAWPRLPGPFPARVWTHPQATAAVPLLDAEHAAGALHALLAAVGQGRGSPAALAMTGLDHNGPTAALLGSAESPRMWLDPRTRAVLFREDQRHGLRGGARKELRRQWNRLAERGRLQLVSASTPDEVAAALERFLALEAKGWKGRRGTALGSTADTRRFAGAALAGLAALGRCRIDALELDGTTLAIGIVLRSRDRDFFWKTAYDEDYARFSPGLQLATSVTSQQLADAAVSVTDSCAVPGHSMIDRIWPSRWDIADCLVATGVAPLRFTQVCAIESRRRKIRTAAKTWLRRFGRR